MRARPYGAHVWRIGGCGLPGAWDGTTGSASNWDSRFEFERVARV